MKKHPLEGQLETLSMDHCGTTAGKGTTAGGMTTEWSNDAFFGVCGGGRGRRRRGLPWGLSGDNYTTFFGFGEG